MTPEAALKLARAALEYYAMPKLDMPDGGYAARSAIAAIDAVKSSKPRAWLVTSSETGEESVRLFKDGDMEKVASGRYAAKFDPLYLHSEPSIDKPGEMKLEGE